MQFLLVLAKIIEAFCVISLIVIGIDLAFYYFKGYHQETKAIKAREKEKARIRQQKELTATGGFFEESFVKGFDSTGELMYRGEHRYPEVDPVWKACRKLDELADDRIFKNTEEL